VPAPAAATSTAAHIPTRKATLMSFSGHLQLRPECSGVAEAHD
jgi:hypothetical protein